MIVHIFTQDFSGFSSILQIYLIFLFGSIHYIHTLYILKYTMSLIFLTARFLTFSLHFLCFLPPLFLSSPLPSQVLVQEGQAWGCGGSYPSPPLWQRPSGLPNICPSFC